MRSRESGTAHEVGRRASHKVQIRPMRERPSWKSSHERTGNRHRARAFLPTMVRSRVFPARSTTGHRGEEPVGRSRVPEFNPLIVAATACYNTAYALTPQNQSANSVRFTFFFCPTIPLRLLNFPLARFSFLHWLLSFSSNRRPLAVLGTLTNGSGAPSNGSPG